MGGHGEEDGSLPSRPRRNNGFQRPFTAEQVAAGVGTAVATILGIALAALFTKDDWVVVSVTVTAVPATVTAVFYVYVSAVDPSKPGGIPCICMKRTQDSPPSYCRICNKTVKGLDHHCVWLNNCVGRRNYWGFFTLATSATVQFAAQTVFACLILFESDWRVDDVDGDAVFFTLFGLYAVGCLVLTASFGTLFLFHSYLLHLRMGTFDWLKYSNGTDPFQAEAPPGSGSSTTRKRRRPTPTATGVGAAGTAAAPASPQISLTVTSDVNAPPETPQALSPETPAAPVGRRSSRQYLEGTPDVEAATPGGEGGVESPGAIAPAEGAAAPAVPGEPVVM